MRDEEFDGLIDDALASYSRVEPRPGFEARVLAHVHGAPKRVLWPWAIAIPAALAIALVAGIGLRQSLPPPTVAMAKPPQAQLTVLASVPSRLPLADARGSEEPILRRDREGAVVSNYVGQDTRRPAPRPPRALPKLDRFPTPAPLTDQERVLLALAARSPELVREMFAEPQTPQVEPIRIEEIRIEPLSKE